MQKITAGELAKVLGISRQAVQKRSVKEGWACIKENNPRGGKPIKYFLVEKLPIDIKERVPTCKATKATNATSNTRKMSRKLCLKNS